MADLRLYKILRRATFAFFAMSFVLSGYLHAQTLELRNSKVIATFGPRGLTSIRDSSGAVYRFSSDEWSLLIDQDRLSGEGVLPQVHQRDPRSFIYIYSVSGYVIQITYTLSPEWNFVSKQLKILRAPAAHYTVHLVETLQLRLVDHPESVYIPGTNFPHIPFTPSQGSKYFGTFDFGAFLRFPQNHGLMLVMQNPFLHIVHTNDSVSLDYQPEMQWSRSWGNFSGDIACIGPYTQTGRRLPPHLTLEWKEPPPDIPNDGADEGEVTAFAAAVSAFLMHPTPKPISVEVAWTLNDYQIDTATPAGREEYKRIIDTTSALGIENLVYSGSNSSLANPDHDIDSWHAGHVLWLDLGQKISEGSWKPDRDVLPQQTRDLLTYARSRHVGVLAYVYPSIPFSGNPSWIVAGKGPLRGYNYSTLASRPMQDMLIHNLITFKHRTGIAGYSFDYAFLNLPGSSAYAQWWGWRRVIEALRRAEPEIVIDGRQTYLAYGPWTWLAGNYPHPVGGDEQPESFTPYPDLHFDRVSADRTRYVNYWYRNYQFAPETVMPGYAFHQTERLRNLPDDVKGSGGKGHVEMVNTSYRARDWDQLGFKYSLLSSIATAGWNNVISMIPARDPEEARAFRIEDQQWIRSWLQWTVDHKEYLLHTRSILGQPAMGKLDGTSAIIGNHGYCFLFNPNYKRLTADVPLDRSIGLDAKGAYSVEEIYPRNGDRIGKPGAGLWSYGDHLDLSMDGTSAIVLEIKPVSELKVPVIFDAASPGPSTTVKLASEILHIDHAAGEPGTDRSLGVLLPPKSIVKTVEINGREEVFTRSGNYITVPVHFAGSSFSQAEEIKLSSTGDEGFSGSFNVPSRILKQLDARMTAWPVKWTKDDYETTWLVPERLLLFVQFVRPEQTEKIEVIVDGKPLEMKPAYTSVRVHDHSFVGWYADLSGVTPDISHEIHIKMSSTATGRFQGVFFDNVTPDWTEALSD